MIGPMADHLRVNRDHWNAGADEWVAAGERLWAAADPCWGAWDIPEHDLGLLPTDMTGLDAIELGCGTAYVSAWMARRGAAVTGIDLSERQLETALRLQKEHDLAFPLIQCNAEAVPLPDGRFDFAVSEYGAALWADPFLWIPEGREAARSTSGRPGSGQADSAASSRSAACTVPGGRRLPFRGPSLWSVAARQSSR